MRYLLIIILIFIIGSCCMDKGLDKIQDKSWFPFNSNSSIAYETKLGLIDSLVFLNLDTLNESGGEWGVCWRWENRSCDLQSILHKDFKIHIRLSSNHLDFTVNHSDKFISMFYITDSKQPSNNRYELNLIDSVRINDKTYFKTLLLTDSTNDLEIYYNRSGILRYVISKDTFDLKEK